LKENSPPVHQGYKIHTRQAELGKVNLSLIHVAFSWTILTNKLQLRSDIILNRLFR
jgi:hypothetical protein